ncbi:MAG: sigma-54 dependent transcriptional regulator [Sphingobacteriales bacterium]|jgi:two-component system response regulator AtoC|nr:sigma-54 dependent transcriptional regulator [Sphingobacteriales bacterium]
MAEIRRKSQSSKLNIFVVEDDAWYRELLTHHLSLNPDNSVRGFESASEVLLALEQETPDAITIDYRLPDLDGQQLIKKIKALASDSALIVISGQEDVHTALELLRQGVYDYLVKNEETRERLWNAINNVRTQVVLRSELEQLRSQVNSQYEFKNLIIGNCESIKSVYHLIAKAAATSINVSLSGETGTGKELVARAIHYNSSRSAHPFVAVNLAAIPVDLVESELFGHEKGSFTGASQSRTGRFEEADGGTLFLDEIADVPLAIQVKLLRAIQEREVVRLGSSQRRTVDVRVITASHKELSTEVKHGRFREDLFYRLLGLPIHLPALKDRGNDKLLLAKHFLDQFAHSNKLGKKQFSSEAKEKLMQYRYPGNVRELKAVVELAAVMSDSDRIEASEISFTASRTPEDLLDQDLTLREYERIIVRHYLDRFDHNVIEAASRLDIGKSTIYKMIKDGEI